MKMEMSQDDFGTLAICALRYCQGRQTYMPSLICGIVRARLKEMRYNDILTMLEDCRMQAEYGCYGDEKIDKPGWLKFKKALEEEAESRRTNDQ